MERNQEPFARTEHGSALFCGCCGKVEVTLGNAVLCLAPEDLPSVMAVIDAFDPSTAPDVADRDYVIRTESGEAAFVFGRRELLELRELILRAEDFLAGDDAPPADPKPRFSRSLLN